MLSSMMKWMAPATTRPMILPTTNEAILQSKNNRAWSSTIRAKRETGMIITITTLVLIATKTMTSEELYTSVNFNFD